MSAGILYVQHHFTVWAVSTREDSLFGYHSQPLLRKATYHYHWADDGEIWLCHNLGTRTHAAIWDTQSVSNSSSSRLNAQFKSHPLRGSEETKIQGDRRSFGTLHYWLILSILHRSRHLGRTWTGAGGRSRSRGYCEFLILWANFILLSIARHAYICGVSLCQIINWHYIIFIS